jgi:hypothetical protein
MIDVRYLKFPILGWHYLIYLCNRSFNGELQAILNITCFFYFLEMSAPFSYYFSSGIPLYIGCVFSVILAFYNDYVFNSEKIEEIISRFDKMEMNYFLILLQFIAFLFFPFFVFFSAINV